MTSRVLEQARRQAGWTQVRLAQALSLSQAYLSLMETGRRPVTDRVARRVARLLHLPPTVLPFGARQKVNKMTTGEKVADELARRGYPGLAYSRKPGETLNPSALLLDALSLNELDARLSEALPWLLLGFEGLDLQGLVARAKTADLQNRLGFTVALARQVAERNPTFKSRVNDLRTLEQALEPSRLAKEDTFGRREKSTRMVEWVRNNRSPEAAHWNLLTDLRVEHLPYAHTDSGPVAQFPS